MTHPAPLRILVGLAIALLAPFALADAPADLLGGIALPPIDLDDIDDDAPEANDDADDAPAGLTAEQAAFYRAHYHRVAARYAKAGERYWACGTYDPRYPSSDHTTVRDWMRRHTETETLRHGNLERQINRKPPMAEAFVAAFVLPGFEVFDYGHIHSAKVVEVVSANEMIVTDIWLLDAEAVKEARDADLERVEKILAIQRDAERQRLEALIRAGRLNDNDGDGFGDGDGDNDNGGGNGGGVGGENEGNNDDDFFVVTQDEVDNNHNHEHSGDDDHDDDDDDCDACVDAPAPRLTRKELVRVVDWRFNERMRLVRMQSKLRGSKVRLIGFDTTGIIPGTRWQGGVQAGQMGPQIAIVEDKTNQLGERKLRFLSRGARILTAVNGDLYKQRHSAEAFAEALAERGLSVGDFCDLAREEMRRDARGAGDRIIARLEAAGRTKRADDAEQAAHADAR